jgi:hypothetical protein
MLKIRNSTTQFLNQTRRLFGSILDKSSLVSSDPLTASGTVYGGIHTLTLIPGDGIGKEMADAVKMVFTGSYCRVCSFVSTTVSIAFAYRI